MAEHNLGRSGSQPGTISGRREPPPDVCVLSAATSSIITVSLAGLASSSLSLRPTLPAPLSSPTVATGDAWNGAPASAPAPATAVSSVLDVAQGLEISLAWTKEDKDLTCVDDELILGEHVEVADFSDVQMTWDSWYNWLEVRFNDVQGTWAWWYAPLLS